jgi:hydroxyproline O-arabinosyltransferase
LQEHKGKPCLLADNDRFLNVSIIHYTYGQDFDERGLHTYGKVGPWHWDKRDFSARYPDLPIPRPAPGTPETAVRLIESVEQAGLSAELWPWWQANMMQN